ncbi:MAG: hypothetical protein DLM58_15970 [Pseudonocardiales bacterium]|nr:MAG: hypothetical protein DLM58_15970 [Pseudonocardiales bacterium]
MDGPRSYWRQLRRTERVCYLLGAVLIASGLLHVGVFAIDGGPLYGPVSWRKPITFGLSFGTTLISVTWVASYLTLSPKARAWLLGIFAADCILEVAGITIQAWRHVPSHFNTETPLNTVIAMNLAVGGGVLIIVLSTLALTAFRGYIDAPPDLRRALRAGFAFLIIGLAVGASMIARGEILIKSGHRQAGYDTAGSLKWVHGVTLHAILVLPAVALLLAHRDWDEQHRIRAITTAIGLYSLATTAALVITLIR